MSWFVQVQNQNYGPYPDAQMQAFVQEGRVSANSLITNDLDAGFLNAAAFDVFKFWSGQQQQMAVGGGAPAYQVAPVAPAAPTQPTPTPHALLITPHAVHQPEPVAQSSRQASVFMVMAEINSEGTMAFLHALQKFGQAERISDTLWLLKSQASVEQLRNALSQTLNRQDRLFLLDSRENKPAWFNIGADLDHRIRDLWQDDEG